VTDDALGGSISDVIDCILSRLHHIHKLCTHGREQRSGGLDLAHGIKGDRGHGHRNMLLRGPDQERCDQLLHCLAVGSTPRPDVAAGRTLVWRCQVPGVITPLSPWRRT
jgi:hypothetical protein